MDILFTICGRAGSKGFKNKNLKSMNGVPLAYYTLAAIYGYAEKHPENNVRIAVNTDSEPLKALFQKRGKYEIFFVERKEELAGDVTPKVAVIQDTYRQLASINPDVVIDLDITSPYRRVCDIENIISEYGDMDNQSEVVKEMKKRGLMFKIMPKFIYKKIVNIF